MVAQTNVFTVDSNGNVTATASVSARSGVGGGTYGSNITATGSTGQTCNLTFANGGGTGGTASVALTSANTITPPVMLTIMSTGEGYTSAPTEAYVSNWSPPNGASIPGACAPVYPDNPNDDDSVLSVATTAMQNHQYSLTSARVLQILSQVEH